MDVQVQPLATPYLIEVAEENTEQISKRMDEIWNSKKSTIKHKGFRDGKVPRSLAEKKIGVNQLYAELLDEIFDEALKQATQEIVGVRQYTVAQFQKDKPVLINAIVDVKPEIRSLKYKGVKVEIEPIAIEDSEVEATIQQMLTGMSEDTVVEREAKKGDIAFIDFVGTIDKEAFPGSDAKNFELELGSNVLIPGFEDQLVGTKAGDKTTVTVTFPEDYYNQSLAKKTAEFEVTINEIKERSKPELTDNFAIELGYESVEDMRTKLAKDLEQDKDFQRKQMIENIALSTLVKETDIDPIPETMVHRALHNTLRQQATVRNTSEEKVLEMFGGRERFNGIFSRQCINDVKARLILEEIAAKEKFEIATSEIDDFVVKEAKRAKIDEAEARKQLNLEAVEKELQLKKAIAFIVDNAQVVEPKKKTKKVTTKKAAKKE